MAKIRKVDFSPDEYINGVSPLTFEEQGIYWMICAQIYSHGGPVDDDAVWLAKRAMGARPTRVRKILDKLIESGKLIKVDSKLSQNRAEAELKYASNRMQSARENGAKGGRPPNDVNDIEKPGGFSGENLSSSSSSSSGKDTPLPPTEAEQVDQIEIDFVTFWKAYPRRVGKGPALKAYRRWRHAIPHGAIMSALDASIRAWRMERPPRPMDKTPHPASWLNREPWHDEHTDPDHPRGDSDADIAAEILAGMPSGGGDAGPGPPGNGRGDTLDLHAGPDGRYAWGDGRGPGPPGEVH